MLEDTLPIPPIPLVESHMDSQPHPFSLRIVSSVDDPSQFLWEVKMYNRLHEHSEQSYPTEPMAAAAGQEAMQACIDKWRASG